MEKPKRVAVYCRVSTDKEDQANSLESQRRFFREFIEGNPLWELQEVYADEGVSGTSTKNRHAFNRMMSDARRLSFDLIVTKEISRFARNTLDSILYTRKLRDLGIGVVFLNDNINTLDADAELRLTIMSSIAQEESRKTSDRVKWGQRRSMERGVVFGRDMLGYDVRGGKLFVNEDGAETVRLIFHKFLNEGKGSHVIARELREAGIPTAAHMKQWSNTVILRVLKNEKYCGDLIQKKTFTPNYLTHEKRYNHGEEELITLRGHHEPIVSRELFDSVQAELARRSPGHELRSKHSSRYCFSGKIKCGLCGRSFVSRGKRRKDGSLYKAWRCYEGARNGAPHIDGAGNRLGCACMSLSDEDAKRLLRETVKSLRIDRQKTTGELTRIISRVICYPQDENEAERIQAKISQLNEKRRRLLEVYLEGGIDKQEFRLMSARLNEERAVTQEQEETCRRHSNLGANRTDLLSEISEILESLSSGDTWDDTFYRHILEKITVFGENRIDVQLAQNPAIWRFERISRGERHSGTSVPMSVNMPVTSP